MFNCSKIDRYTLDFSHEQRAHRPVRRTAGGPPRHCSCAACGACTWREQAEEAKQSFVSSGSFLLALLLAP